MTMRILITIALVLVTVQLSSAQMGLEQQENAELGQWPANVHRCVHTTNKVRKRGDGSTVGSCSSCDPATADCGGGCQDLINRMYWACTEVCLPDGYYFDPNKMLSGCWEDNEASMKINVERCGCNSSSRSYGSSLGLTVLLGSLATAWLIYLS